MPDSAVRPDALLAGTSPLGLGCWALGGKQWGGQAETRSMEVMQEALDRGVRHFDTAQGYGASEDLVGRFLAGRRDSVFLASKVYPRSPQQIRETLEQSLRRLQTDYIDLYYLHWPREGLAIGPQMEVLAEAREQGLIRAIGVSNYTVRDLQEAMAAAPVDFLQVGYHLFWRIIEAEILPFCRKHNIRVVSYCSLGQGILSGKFPRTPVFPKGDHRPNVLHFREDVWPWVYSAVEALKPLAERAGRPLSHLALRWVAAQPGITGVLAGARNQDQMEANALAFEGELDPAILHEMTKISDGLTPHLPVASNIFGKHD